MKKTSKVRRGRSREDLVTYELVSEGHPTSKEGTQKLIGLG
jgi:hypothetical protein